MRVTILAHAADRMAEFGISEQEVRLTVGQPEEEGAAKLGRRYAQRQIGHRLVRVVYNFGAEDERIVVTAMLRRKRGSA